MIMKRQRDDKGRTLEEFLAAYRPGDYPRPSLTADAIVFTHDRQLLLIKRANHPYIDCWALPGGFVGEKESCSAAAERELKEETGLSLGVRPLVLLSAPERDPRTRVVSMAYLALTGQIPPAAGDDAGDAGWFHASAAREGERVILRLDGPERLTAFVDCARRDGKIDPDRSVCGGDLAFDHAAAIAYAMEELKWI